MFVFDDRSVKGTWYLRTRRCAVIILFDDGDPKEPVPVDLSCSSISYYDQNGFWHGLVD